MFLGDAMVYAIGHSVACSLIGCSANAPATIPEGRRLQVTLTPYASKTICDAEVSVYMGGTDITSIAYSNGVVTIDPVMDDVVINAAAYQIITFDSASVKTICLEQSHVAGTPLAGQPWAGNHFSNEMTVEEAALVTSLNDAFYQQLTSNCTFHELQYFTALKSLYSQNISGYASGQFYQCTGLTAVTIPAAPIENQAGAFRGCSKLVSVDFTPITDSHLQLAGIVRNCSAIKSVKIKGGTYQTTSGGTLSITHAFRECTQLETIIIDGTADWSKVTNYANAFYKCTALSTVTGAITGIKENIDLHYCPLTASSVLVFLNGLGTVSSAKTITLNASMKTTYEADANFVAASSALPNNWTIAWS